MVFFRTAKHKLIIKTEDIISNHNVGIFSLHQLLPRQQHFFFGGIAFNRRIGNSGTCVQRNAVVQIRFRAAIIEKGRTDKRHLVAFQCRKL